MIPRMMVKKREAGSGDSRNNVEIQVQQSHAPGHLPPMETQSLTRAENFDITEPSLQETSAAHVRGTPVRSTSGIFGNVSQVVKVGPLKRRDEVPSRSLEDQSTPTETARVDIHVQNICGYGTLNL
ncbi:hypothetical protein ElyMa_000719000 [Elysia marginata]|uniref:Uncharacterized protein n=1 Tax=Elysia marginata TaxID=1093978 RepID=A0AAV4GLF9_9GAST|nr:hypothetical protein ElyMa_000719000 [Elysia marginata]